MIHGVLSVLDQFFLYVPLLIGAYISFSLMKIPNFSIEPAFVTGAVMTTLLLPFIQGMPAPMILLFVVLSSLIGGGIVGLIASQLNTIGKIPHLLAHILTMGIGFGLNLFLLGVPNVSLTNFSNPLATNIINLHPELLMTGLISSLMIMAAIFLLRSQIGFCIAIYGNNPRFFASNQASVSYVVCCGVVVSNALAGLSGYLVSQSSGFVDISAGTGIALFCLTALILGKTLLQRAGFIFSVVVPIVGLMMYCIIQHLLLKLGFNLKYFMVCQALIVVVLLVIHYRKHASPDVHTDHLGI